MPTIAEVLAPYAQMIEQRAAARYGLEVFKKCQHDEGYFLLWMERNGLPNPSEAEKDTHRAIVENHLFNLAQFLAATEWR